MTEQPSPRILVIDDEITQRMLMKEYLEEAGFQVRLADDGHHGLKMASTVALDLVIVDAILPGLDGYSLCAELKRGAKTADLPIILITASKEPDAITRGLSAGATDFITKPIEWQFLADRVKTVLEAADHRRRLEAAAERMAAELEATRSHDAERAEDGQRARLADERAARELEEAKREVEKTKREGDARIAAERVEAARRRAEASEQHARELEAARAATRTAEAALTEERRRMTALLEQERKALRAQADDRVAKAQLAANALLEASRKTAEQQLRAARSKAEAESAELRSVHSQRLAELERAVAEANARGRLGEADAGASRGGPGEEAAQGIWSLVEQVLHEALVHARTIYGECRRAEAEEIEPAARKAASIAAADAATALLSRLKAFETLASASANRIEAGRASRFDLAAVVRDVEGRLAPIVAERRARISVEAEASPLPVDGNEAHVRMALVGLALNAAQHALPGSEVRIEARRVAPDLVEVRVSDRGPGLQPAQVARLGASASSGKPSRDPQRSRLGLGLAIAGAVARSHGGTLALASTFGTGTTVTLAIPCADAGEVAARPALQAAS
jgi:CheY-like chemotaxis protein